jgi:hypothetical protein
MSLIGLLFVLIVLCVVFWAVKQVMVAFGTPPQIQTVVVVLFVLIVVLWLVQSLGVLSLGPRLRL